MRSAIYNIVLFVVFAAFLVFGSVLFFFDKKYAFSFWEKLSSTIDFITQRIAGITYKIENLPSKDAPPRIYAVRHESMWETLVMIHFFKEPIFLIKKALADIPFFGSMARKVGTIAVDREGGARALVEVTKKVEKAINDGHSIVIFPEGTRVANGEHVELKRGIAMFYKKTNCSVVPVVHNSGKFWPRRGFLKKPGTVSVKFLNPIPSGLHQDDFMDKLNNAFYTEIEKLKNEQ